VNSTRYIQANKERGRGGGGGGETVREREREASKEVFIVHMRILYSELVLLCYNVFKT
jgi:hypothetical protein